MGRILIHSILSLMLLITATGMTINVHSCQYQSHDALMNATLTDCCVNNSVDQYCDMGLVGEQTNHCNNISSDFRSPLIYLIPSILPDLENLDSVVLTKRTQYLKGKLKTEESELNKYNYNLKVPPQEVELSRIQSFLI